MQLTLTRTSLGEHSTLGELFVDGAWQAFTLEPGSLDGKGPIPEGGYDVVVDLSQRFGRRMPRILGVPGREGILIHSGNTDKDTAGCVLVGLQQAIVSAVTTVLHSRAAFDALFTLLDAAQDRGETIRITIKGAV